MEVMRNAVVKTRTLKPLPGEITSQRINDATLPVKIEAARRAIAECTDLPELLRYKSQAEGLAAAVRTMKEVGPELIKRANEMMADAWRKGGELLNQYSNVHELPQAKGAGRGNIVQTRGAQPSPRGKIGQSLGLDKREIAQMVRIHKASKNTVYEAVQNSHSMSRVARQVPAVSDRNHNSIGAIPRSQPLRLIIGDGVVGLRVALSAVKRVPLDQFQHLTPNERKVVKAKITEIVELLDEMDRLCR